MPPLTPNTFDQELDLLFAAADDFHDTESPRSNPPGGKRSSPDNDEDDDEGHNSGPEDENTNPNNENEAALEDQTPSEQQLFVKRLAKRLKLNSARAADVEKFSKEAIGTKLIMLYSETISLSDKVNKLTESVGPAGFSLTKEAIDNIKLIVKQAFFNPAVKSYKTEDTIKLLVINRVRDTLVGIPRNLEEVNPQGWTQIESRVGYEVTQLRGAIKKVLKDDSQLDPGKQKRISALTKAVVGKTSKSEIERFGVELHMRIALFRKLYPKHPGEDFWGTVDLWLDKMRQGGRAAYEKAMTGLISLDRNMYGIEAADAVAQ